MKEQIRVYKDTSNLKPVRNFLSENFPERNVSRGIYLSPLYHFSHSTPLFYSDSNADHEEDFYNIPITLKRQGIRPEEASIIIFDAHTDMYKAVQRTVLTEKPINMANWVLHLLHMGFTDVSLVGVSDFTRSSPEVPGFEYWRYADRVSFFTGADFKHPMDFLGPSYGRVSLKPVEDFLNKPLRKKTFISLDCDVSPAFSDMNDAYIGYTGATGLLTLCNMIRFIRANSDLAGFSVFGRGFGDPYVGTNKKSLLEVMKSLE